MELGYSAHEALKVKQAVNPASYAAGTYYNGDSVSSTAGIDTLGEDEALVIVNVGAIASTGTCDVSLVSNTTNTSAGATAVTDKDGTAQALAQMPDTGDNLVWVMRVRCKDIHRYLFVKVVTANAATILGVSVVFTKGKTYPVTQDNTVITAAKHN